MGKYFKIKSIPKTIKFIENLPKKQINLLSNYLLWREYASLLPNFPQRYFVRLFKICESDISCWKVKNPEIVDEAIGVSFGNPLTNKAFSNSNINKIKKIKGKIDELIEAIGEERVNKIINCYKQKSEGTKYLNFLEEFDESNFEKLKIKYGYVTVTRWLRIPSPNAIKILLRIHDGEYHKIPPKVLARLIGWGMGDGGIMDKGRKYFVCGKKEDLESIVDFIKQNIPKISLVRIITNNGGGVIKRFDGKIKKIKANESWIVYVGDKSFGSLLYSYGLPKGRKVLTKFNIPAWIKDGSKEVKKAFLNSIFECEGQKHRVTYNKKRNKIDINPISFGIGKVVQYQENLVKFLNELRMLFLEFGINVSEVEKPRLSCLRKDGNLTCLARFAVSTSMSDVIRFSRVIDYRFNKEKQIALNEAVIEARVKLKRVMGKIEKYKRAIELSRKGYKLWNISKITGVHYNTIEQWVKTKKHLPYLINADIEGLLNG
ncbi:MAG: hypothetical protein ABID38_06525 [Candidatus Diapherotrites archaeon]